MAATKNVLFIMCDQLRWDYLSCYGHPHLHTPNIDKLAERGVRFDRAYVQSPICCPSRASFYTGRFMSSHGASINFAAMRPDELGLGDYLAPLGVRTAVVGKTHSFPAREGLDRLGIDATSDVGQHVANIGFEPYWRDDGLHPNDARSQDIEYNRYLREQGYESQNGWQEHANGIYDEDDVWRNGFFLDSGRFPANIEEHHSETPYTTRKATQFIDDAGDAPWCLHLSYIKPHWPYVAPAPYDTMYGPEHFLPLVAEEGELDRPNPVYEAFTQSSESRGFQRPEARAAVITAYMGLIKQLDDQIGELMAFMDERGLTDETLIVFTSDHGDYLGDHWMGEKSWFHDASVRVPLIVVDPSVSAENTRNTVNRDLVHAIDLVPTFIETLGGTPASHRLEGHSLLPLLHGNTPNDWRTFAVSEVDFSDRSARFTLNAPVEECNAVMICTERWKYIHIDAYPPQLFDLENDPNELKDLGTDTAYGDVVAAMQQHLITFLLRRKTQTTVSTAKIDTLVGGSNRENRGIIIGYHDESDLPADVTVKQRAPRQVIKNQSQDTP